MKINEKLLKGITIYDPIIVVLGFTKELYPDLKCHIQYDYNLLYKWWQIPFKKTQLRCSGLTAFKDDGTIFVNISAHLPVKYVPSVLCHELAHAIVGYSEGHGKEWQKVFDKLCDAYDGFYQENE